MITICHPVDDVELLLLRLALQEADIPYFVVGDYFGSLYPGIQLPWYNERSIRVPAAWAEEAAKVVQELRSTYTPASANLKAKSKLRMLFEGFFLGWVVPGGTKKTP